MKSALAIAALLVCLSARSANVAFNLADFTTTGITNRLVQITPIANPKAVGTQIISADRLYYYSDTNGTFTASNVVVGKYTCELLGPYARSRFCLQVPDATTNVDAYLLITSCGGNALDLNDGTPLDLE